MRTSDVPGPGSALKAILPHHLDALALAVGISSHTCAEKFSVSTHKGTFCLSLEFSPLQHSVLHTQPPWCPQTLHLLASGRRRCLGSPQYARAQGLLLKPVSCNSHGVHLFPISQGWGLSDVRCLENRCFIYIVCVQFCCFKWEGESGIWYPIMTRSRSLF